MIYLHNFIYYAFFCSSVLFFGIGLNRSIQITTVSLRINFKVILKSLISIVVTTILSFLIIQYLLIPIKMAELFPLISLLIFLCINTFIEALVRITAKISTSEFSISWLIIILSLYESSTLLEAMLISASCMLSFQIMLPIVYCFQKLIYLKPFEKVERKQILIILSIAVLILVFSVCDITWLSVLGGNK
ncbi:MAG: hypothetical protein MJ182_02365 [Treponema sp.]|nr:hypothetical protein [Treponema sp.]